MFLKIAPDLLQIGLSSSVVVVRGVDNTRISPELIAHRRHVGRRLGSYWNNRSISEHPAIREYHRVHAMFGVTGEQPAPEKLIQYVRRNQDFTSSGAVVDCYNIVSAKTLLSIGAHDLAKLSAPIALRKCTASDVFIPLGETEEQRLTGEYGYVDSQERIICRLDVLQCEHSKTTRDSRDIVFFLQGNKCLSSAVLLKGTWLLAEMVERFNGGKAEIVHFFDAGNMATIGSSKPLVTFEDFSGLEFRKGTVLGVEPLPDIPDLSSVSVQIDGDVSVIAPTLTLPKNIAGREVVVAINLHPMTVAGHQFTSYLMTGSTQNGCSVMGIESGIPDGKKLY